VNAAAPCELRLATPDDRGFVLELSASCFGHLGDYRGILGGWFDHEGVRTTLAVDPVNGPAGFVMHAFVRGELDLHPTADLIAIAVASAARRRGVARLLLESAIGLARTEAGLIDATDRIRLDVAADNAAARALFEAAGFVHRPRRDGRYPNGQRYLRLELCLRSGRPTATRA